LSLFRFGFHLVFLIMLPSKLTQHCWVSWESESNSKGHLKWHDIRINRYWEGRKRTNSHENFLSVCSHFVLTGGWK
jgi:hypothetical protein